MSNVKALYELKRQGFLIGYIAHPDKFDPALAYAYEHRIAPIFHENVMREDHEGDPFESAYSVSAEFASEVTGYLDELWLEKKFDEMGFYSLEDRFGGHHANRMELIHILEYTRISGRFDNDVFDAVAADAPTEAKPIASTFPPSEIYFG